MAAALPILAVLGPLLSGGMKLLGGLGAKKAGGANAEADRAEAAESARREEAQNAEDQARGRAAAAASGVTTAGTPGRFLEEQEAEARRQIDWLGKAGESRAKASEREGTQGLYKGVGGAIGSFGSVATKLPGLFG